MFTSLLVVTVINGCFVDFCCESGIGCSKIRTVILSLLFLSLSILFSHTLVTCYTYTN